MERNFKVILDSVHGSIYIPSNWVKDIIDSVYFQRLRRIEQTSCRSVFPSARHDRFIHSLGVFHLGSQIVDSIKKNSNGILPHDSESIFNSYRLACLLHDIGHSPFSHTFENYYEYGNSLNDELTKEFSNEQFKEDLSYASDMKPHEKMSALLAAMQFKDILDKYGVDRELIVRMIIGCKYREKAKSFSNAMIELIHGDIIDADRLDYALRDVWAAGYNTSTINVQRLIDNIIIKRRAHENEYYVCYSSKALNEIESVLNVKNFQNLYIFNHHKIIYEQKLLVEAMKSASEFHWNGKISDDENKRDEALRKTCQFSSMFESLKCACSNYSIIYPMDDDFISMMKCVISSQTDYSKDSYINQWLSRSYTLKPLWKSKAEFYSIFGKTLENIPANNINSYLEWLSGKGVLKDILRQFNLNPGEVWVEKRKTNYSELDPQNILISVGDDTTMPLDSLAHDSIGAIGEKKPFSYIFVKTNTDISKEDYLDYLTKTLINMIKNNSLDLSL